MKILPKEAVRQLDRTAIEVYGLPGLVLMENAARGITDVYLREFHLQQNEQTFIFCGTGNNAGDGLAIARQLMTRNFPCRLFLCTNPARFRGDTLIQYEVAKKLRIPMELLFEASNDEEVLNRLNATIRETSAFSCVDAMLGTGATGSPRFPMNVVIPWLNEYSPRTLAVDLPSGLDCETGKPYGEAVRAAITVTLAAAKPGLILPEAAEYVGQLFLSDIGFPLLAGAVAHR